jgi:hypothetical protein
MKQNSKFFPFCIFVFVNKSWSAATWWRAAILGVTDLMNSETLQYA